jgi:hypothetical protein
MNNGASYLSDAIDFVHRSFLTVDAQLGLLIIALIAAFMMKAWKQIFPIALVAVVIDIIVMALWPLVNHGSFHLPDFFLLSFWLNVVALYIGFLVVIAVFYFLRTTLLKAAKA